MNKTVFAAAILIGVAFISCKGKKNDEASTSPQTEAAPSTTAPSTSNTTTAATAMTVTAMPDSATLGKNSELLITIKKIKAIQLTDPDGKVTGTELTYDIQATNKGAMGNGNITVNPSYFRLELDNGTKISHESYNSFNVDAEATASSTGNTFKLDPGTKPVALDLFYDETRAVIKLSVQ